METRVSPLSFLIFIALAGVVLPSNAEIIPYNIGAVNESGVSMLNPLISLDIKEGDALVLNNYNGTGQVTSKFDPTYTARKNPNLTGASASLIVLQTQSDRSQINGMTEILGASADLVMVNPNGISCNGCGFINTNNVTLATGVVAGVANSSNLEYDTRSARGGITIGEKGLVLSEHDQNAKNINLVAQTIAVNGSVNANNLTAIANIGVTRLDNLASNTTLESDRSATIDISNIGSINATGKINLVVNARGAGVNNSHLQNSGNISSGLTTGDAIEINANNLLLTNNGKLIAGSATQRSNISINSARLINAAAAEIAGANINLTTMNDILNRGQISGSGTVNITTNDLENSTAATVNGATVAINNGRNLVNAGAIAATTNLNITSSNDLNNSGSLNGAAVTISNSRNLVNSGTIAATTNLGITSGNDFNNSGSLNGAAVTINNSRNLINSGTLAATTNLGITSGNDFNNSGSLNGAAVTINNSRNLVNSGTVAATTNLDITSGADLNNSSTLTGASVTINNTRNLLNAGSITASNNLTMTIGSDVNNSGTLDVNAGSLNLTANSLNNSTTTSRLLAQQAKINISNNINNLGAIRLSGASDLNYSVFNNQQGTVDLNNSVGKITFNGNRLNNSAAINLNGAAVVEFNRNIVENTGSFTVGDNSIAQFKQGEFNNQATGTLDNRHTLSFDDVNFSNRGTVMNAGALSFLNGRFLNQSTAGISGNTGSITFTDLTSFSNSGPLRANTIAINALNLMVKNNNIIETVGAFTSNSRSFYNNGTVTVGSLSITSNDGSINNNTGASFISRGAALFSFANQTFNNRGTITGTAGNTLNFSGYALQNEGQVNGNATVRADLTQLINSTTGNIDNQLGDITFNVSSIFVNNGRINAKDINVLESNIDFTNNNTINATGKFIAKVRDFSNQNLSASDVAITASRNINNYGQLNLTNAQASSNLTARSLNNEGTIVSSNSSLTTTITNDLTNTGSITATLLTLNARGVENSGTIATASLVTQVSNLFNRLGGVISASTRLALNTLTGANTRIINDGTITTTGTASAAFNAAQLNNTGTINLANGVTMAAAGSLKNSGTIQGGGIFTLGAADINNSGTITSTAGAITLTATNSLDNSGTIKSATADDRARGDITLTANTISIGNKVTGKRVTFNAADTLTTRQGSILEAGYLNLMAKNQILNYATTIARTLEVTVTDGNLINRGWLYGKDSVKLAVRNGNIYNANRIKGLRTETWSKCLFNYDMNGLGSGRIYADTLIRNKT